MLERILSGLGDAYFFQQCIVFLLWMGLLRIAYGEVRALWREGPGKNETAVGSLKREDNGCLRAGSAGSGRKVPERAWRVGGEAPLPLRRGPVRRIRKAEVF